MTGKNHCSLSGFGCLILLFRLSSLSTIRSTIIPPRQIPYIIRFFFFAPLSVCPGKPENDGSSPSVEGGCFIAVTSREYPAPRIVLISTSASMLFNFFSDISDMGPDNVSVGFRIKSPYLLHNMVRREYITRMVYEQFNSDQISRSNSLSSATLTTLNELVRALSLNSFDESGLM